MDFPIWSVIVIVGVLAYFGLAVLVAKIMRGRISSIPTLHKTPRPCFRCGVVATDEYLSIPYCMICKEVVAMTLPGVRSDPPYGFPGSPGYFDWPEKKEG